MRTWLSFPFRMFGQGAAIMVWLMFHAVRLTIMPLSEAFFALSEEIEGKRGE